MADQIQIVFVAKDQFSRVSKKLNASLNKNKESFRQLDQTMKNTASTTDKAGGRMTGVIGKLTAGIGLAIVAAKLLRGVMSSLSQGLETETAVNKILTLTSTAEEAARVAPLSRATIRSQANATRFGIAEVGDALTVFLAARGIENEQFDKFGGVVDLAQGIPGSSLEAVARGVTKVLNANPDLRGDAGALGNRIFASSQAAAALPNEVLNALVTSGGQLAVAGVDFREQAALVAALSQVRGTPDIAANELRSLFDVLRTTDPSSPAGGFIRSLEIPLGAAELAQFPAEEILAKVNTAFLTNPLIANKAIVDKTAQAAALAFIPEIQALTRESLRKGDEAEFNLNSGLQQSIERTTSNLSGDAIKRDAAVRELRGGVSAAAAPLVNAVVESAARGAAQSTEADRGVFGFSIEVISEIVKDGIRNGLKAAFPGIENVPDPRGTTELDARGIANTPTGSVGVQTVTD